MGLLDLFLIIILIILGLALINLFLKFVKFPPLVDQAILIIALIFIILWVLSRFGGASI